MRGNYSSLRNELPTNTKHSNKYDSAPIESRLHLFLIRRPTLSLIASIGFILFFILLASLSTSSSSDRWQVEQVELSDSFWDQGQVKGWKNNNHPSISTSLSTSLPILKWTEKFSNECVDQYISQGTLCKEGIDFGEERRVDVCYTYVNGTDSLLTHWRKQISNKLGGNKKVAGGWVRWGDSMRNLKHFREHDELKYSLRSILASFSTDSINQIHLLTTDLPFGIIPSSLPFLEESLSLPFHENSSITVGQIPNWLNLEALESTSSPKLNLAHHSEFFSQTMSDRKNPLGRDWLLGSLPTFSSLAIESQIYNLKNIADHVLYMNDDVLLFGNLTSSDVGSPLTGPVFRLQSDLKVDGLMGAYVGDREGEWPSLRYSNYLLDKRFGMRKRNYLVHIGKTISMPLLREAAQMFEEEFTITGLSRFRGRDNINELQMAFLSTHYIIERHREALLYSFFIARSDLNQDGMLSISERRKMVKELGNPFEKEKVGSEGFLPVRDSLKGLKEVCDSTGIEGPQATEFSFTSLDGYVGGPTSSGVKWPIWKNEDEEEEESTPQEPICHFEGNLCLGEDFLSSSTSISTSDIFKRVAFQYGEACGDCAIILLLNRSGKKGLESFLPAKPTSSSSSSSNQELVLEGLGMTKDWKSIDFAPYSSTLLSPTLIRQRAVRLIQRYSYIVGDTTTSFISIRGHASLVTALAPLNEEYAKMNSIPVSTKSKELPSFLTLNDDVIQTVDKVKLEKNLLGFFNLVWPIKAPWEE